MPALERFRHSAPLGRLAAWLAVAALWLCACGSEQAGPEREAPANASSQPPLMAAAREGLPAGATGVSMTAVDAVHVVFVLEGAESRPSSLQPRTLKAGETVRIWWRAEHAPVDPDVEHGHEALRLRFGYEDWSSMWAESRVPGGSGDVAVKEWALLPPPTAEPMTLGEDLELLVVAGARLPLGQLEIRPGRGAARVSPSSAVGTSPAPTVLRLKLRVRKIGAGGD